MTTSQISHPSWYTKDDDTAWSRVKAAFQRDWQQTEHDFGAKVPDLNQQVGDTVGQATGSKPIPPANTPTPHPSKSASSYRDQDEDNYRYGYAAYRHFVPSSEMDDDDWDVKESIIRDELADQRDWDQRREGIRRGWEYGRLERRRITPK